jgi:hypothetical protein
MARLLVWLLWVIFKCSLAMNATPQAATCLAMLETYRDES